MDAVFGCGDEEATAQLLAQRPELLNERDNRGRTPLHWAARKGYGKISEQLLAQSPELADVFTRKKWTALHYAAQGGDETIVTQLLAHTSRSALIGASCSEWTVLDCALAKGHEKIVGLLLDYYPELIESVSFRGFSALYLAANRGYDKAMARVLARCPKLDPWGFTPLHGAAWQGHDKIVAQLLAYNPSIVNVTDGNGSTALHGAAEYGHEQVVAQLLACNPKLINGVTCSGETVLHSAVSSKSDKVLARLLACKPELIDAVNSRGETSLQHAFRSPDFSAAAVEFLLAAKPEQIARVDREGNTLLHRAVTRSHLFGKEEAVAKVWRADPAALRVANLENLTPFHLAAKFKHWKLIELFQWEFSLDEIESAFGMFGCSSLERVRPAIDKQCESLRVVLNQDVTCVVYQYLGFDPKKTTKNNTLATKVQPVIAT